METKLDFKIELQRHLARIVARGQDAEKEVLARIKKDGLAEAMSWCAVGALELGTKANIAASLLKAVNEDRWPEPGGLYKYCVHELMRGVQGGAGTRSTNVLEAPKQIARCDFWADLVEFVGALLKEES